MRLSKIPKATIIKVIKEIYSKIEKRVSKDYYKNYKILSLLKICEY